MDALLGQIQHQTLCHGLSHFHKIYFGLTQSPLYALSKDISDKTLCPFHHVGHGVCLLIGLDPSMSPTLQSLVIFHLQIVLLGLGHHGFHGTSLISKLGVDLLFGNLAFQRSLRQFQFQIKRFPFQPQLTFQGRGQTSHGVQITFEQIGCVGLHLIIQIGILFAVDLLDLGHFGFIASHGLQLLVLFGLEHGLLIAQARDVPFVEIVVELAALGSISIIQCGPGPCHIRSFGCQFI